MSGLHQFFRFYLPHEVHISGGEHYDALNTGFILASVNPNAERTVVTVEGHLVEIVAGPQE